MPISPEILDQVQQLTDELDRIELQVNEGLVLASQLLDPFPDSARLISLSANVGNGLFFVESFRSRIESIVERISRTNVSVETIQDAGEELSEFWGRILKCKMTVSSSVNILKGLQ
jgi:methyl-accepting chemotaxis protein